MTAITNAPAILADDASHLASFGSWLKTRSGDFTADEIRPWAEMRQLSGPQIGALFRAAHGAGLIRHVGWSQSRVESNRGRQIQIWRLR